MAITCGRNALIGSVALIGAALAAAGALANGAPDAGAAPIVGVITVERKEIVMTKDAPGRIAPMRIAEVRPRVSGIVLERSFEQGSVVSKGAVLYRIDPTQFEIDLDSARAALARAEATLSQASRQESRLKELVKGQTTTQAQYEMALSAARQAEADVMAQKAAVRRAEVNLEYATVRAPISGRIGRAMVTEGALASQEQLLPFATIQQLDPIYADFTQSVSEMDALKEEFARGGWKPKSGGAVRTRLILDNGKTYPHEGRLLFSDITVDPGTNQVTLRAEFPNPDAALLPGAYVRVQIEEGVRANTVTVPRQAVQRNNAGGAELFVVNDQDRAILQPVRLGRTLGDEVVVEEGLHPGNRVVVEGFQKFMSGGRVDPQPFPYGQKESRADRG
ncbi:efflux RND transporter periplasmic adaptor subunit [uncultured Rhodoblastus sp.]|uniref:efflux RND transporter periplasmic adaptor subunit n=1 Tax=uncultured Rhodoblastus sp. TaxID=543037 RepID=UPI0025E18F2D|nr:efflux RND transporter periplasmic adaptor subunit [uncultured Rhodoblastus sp.]